jgi:hypothetical protein
MRRTCFMLMFVLACGLATAAEPKLMRWDFEDAASGSLPQGWSAAQTGQGEGSVWKIVDDESAPKGPKVLAQTANGPGPLFNLCVADESNFVDGEIAVSFKAVRGKIDQGGGIVWRYADANNYYIARMNPLENNFRLYKVVNGQRSQLATKEGVTTTGEWHTLSIRQAGDQIECLLDGNKQMEAKDGTFKKAGKVGLWTKADAQTNFDELVVSPR